ncbi:ADP-ribose pyrophosphatase YjhB, NUDIX family [Brevibacterium sp. 239c]|uniref:NUDIX domain-containing protein n=1 Tax=Brevibacterium sp. 239c TaxID=1965356 RepID=UPI000C5E3B92|nr:NUDIX hydrolase [Brevibacterium sp. 239c]SMY03240.1 ADP-ribose pyrophosphatase YjhB, NUDIX family [Brevibacterium sp. 239c]
MKLHDGNCHDFDIEHAGLPDANAWGITSRATRLVQPDTPVVGWRYMVVAHVAGTVIRADGLDGDNPTFWNSTLAAPQAECDVVALGPRNLGDVARRLLDHGRSPDPECECGYRVVRSVTELTKYLQWAEGQLADFPVSELPEDLRVLVEPLGDTVSQSVVLLPVLGCGQVAGARFENYQDPDETLRVEYFASLGQFIASEGDPVIDALRSWGAEVVVVPSVTGVHGPGDCDARGEVYTIWRLMPPVGVEGVVLREGDATVSGDGWTEAGRFGEFGAAGAAVISDGKVLLVWSNSRWQLPGGARMGGESVGECVVREVAEETGVDLVGVPVRSAFARSDAAGWSYTTVVVDAPAGVFPVADAEVSDWGWFADPPVGMHPDLLETWDRITTP